MAPQVETPEEKNYYRVRSLTPERYQQLLAIKEEARHAYAYIHSAPYCAGSGNGPDNQGCLEGFDYEIELIEATRALAETVELLHNGCAPEEVLDAVELDEVSWIAGTSVSDILGMYRTFRLTGRINTWEQHAALEQRVVLTRSTVRWRLRGSTLREIAQEQVPQTLAKWFPNGVSRDTIRRILVPYGRHERGLQVTEQTYNRCRDD